MKKVLLKIITALVAVVMLFSLTACEKISKLEINITVYDVEADEMVEKTLTYNVHESLAPNATREIKKLIADGYYNDAFFYSQNTANGDTASSLMFFGGLNRVDGVITQNTPVAIPEADFTHNGYEGSNLVNNVGYIGLWKTWNYNQDYTKGNQNSNSTMFMPTTSLSNYNGYFCVFAKYASSDDLELLKDIIDLLDTADYTTEYVCYYSANANGGLEKDADGNPVWNIMEADDFEIYSELNEKWIFSADSDKEESIYNQYTVTALNADKLVINSIKVK